MTKKTILFILIVLHTSLSWSQRIIYSEPERGDFRQSNFEILGKFNNNVLVFRNQRSDYAITVLDPEMKQKERVKLTFLPDKIINPDFVSFPDHLLMFYQYQKRNVVYAMAAKLGGDGKIIGEPVELDTTEISFLAGNKIYTVINSDNKQYLGLFKINSKDEDQFLVTTLLFNAALEKLEKQLFPVEMPDRNDYLSEFQLSNAGDFVFVRATQESENDKVQKLDLLVKEKEKTEVRQRSIAFDKIWLDDVRVKVDNFNNTYIISSFYAGTRRGNIDGFFTALWDKAKDTTTAIRLVDFDDNLRNLAKGDNSMKNAFNDYFIKNFIVRKDGGFLIAAESLFTSGRGGGFNRFDYMYGSPLVRPLDYYMFPYGYSYGNPWWRYNNMGQTIRYNAQNIMVLNFDASGELSWAQVISKNQYDDETDALISFSVMNTGDQLHFFFNQAERRAQLLTSNSVSPSGQVTRNPTLKSLSVGYDIMARYGKQTGSRQIIFPCIYRNYLCFAKLEL